MIIKTKEYASHSYLKALIISLKESLSFLFSFCIIQKEDLIDNDGFNSLSMKPYLDTDENGYIKCISCDLCAQLCPQDALEVKTNQSSKKLVKCEKPFSFILNIQECSSCQICLDVCPTQALKLNNISQSANHDAVDLIKIVEK